MLELVGGKLLAAVFGGGATGLLGSIATGFTNYKMKKLECDHEIKRINAESQAIRAEAEANVKIQDAVTSGKIAIAEMDAYKESVVIGNKELFKESYMKLLHDSGKPGKVLAAIVAFFMGCTDIWRSGIRPVATTYLLIMSTVITIMSYFILKETTGEAITQEMAFEIFRDAVTLMLYLTSTCLSWWFCDRQTTKFAKKLLDKT